jgi:hypothetical protein
MVDLGMTAKVRPALVISVAAIHSGDWLIKTLLIAVILDVWR